MRFLAAAALIVISLGCSEPPVTLGSQNDGGSDAGTADAVPQDAGGVDAGDDDAGSVDAGTSDAGSLDAGIIDAGTFDGGIGADAGLIVDGGVSVAGTIIDIDTNCTDGGIGDAGAVGAAGCYSAVDFSQIRLFLVDPTTGARIAQAVVTPMGGLTATYAFNAPAPANAFGIYSVVLEPNIFVAAGTNTTTGAYDAGVVTPTGLDAGQQIPGELAPQIVAYWSTGTVSPAVIEVQVGTWTVNLCVDPLAGTTIGLSGTAAALFGAPVKAMSTMPASVSGCDAGGIAILNIPASEANVLITRDGCVSVIVDSIAVPADAPDGTFIDPTVPEIELECSPVDAGPCPCTCDDGTCPVAASGECDDATNCLAPAADAGVCPCLCDDGTCAVDSTGLCDDGMTCSVPASDGGQIGASSDAGLDAGWLPWTPAANRELTFILTLAGECSDGGYVFGIDENDLDGGFTVEDGGPHQGELIVECPTSTAGDCPSTTLCSWNPAATPLPPSYAGVFEVAGEDFVGPPGSGHEVAVTFAVPKSGIPISVGLVVTRTPPANRDTVPADLLVDIVPTSAGVPIESSYIVRARVNVGDLEVAETQAITLVFESSFSTVLDPTQVYALYAHIEAPGVDKVGLSGAEEMTDPGSVSFIRQYSSE